MTCPACNDTGLTGYERPMRGADGLLHMVFIPQICMCDAGDKHASKYEQNLSEGKAGMDGIDK